MVPTRLALAGKMLEISGVQKVSMIDYPHRLSAIVFLPKCNFRCGFCYNPELVFDQMNERVPEQELLDYLEKRIGWLDAVCITGGEPTLHNEVIGFLEKTKKMGYLNKIDTNGSNPEMLERLLEAGTVDYVAMDIKAPLERYEEVCNAKISLEAIKKSAELVKKFPDYEYRTTIVPGIHSAEDLEKIIAWLGKGKRYFLQKFREDFAVLDEKAKTGKRFSEEELECMKKIIAQNFAEAGIR